MSCYTIAIEKFGDNGGIGLSKSDMLVVGVWYWWEGEEKLQLYTTLVLGNHKSSTALVSATCL